MICLGIETTAHTFGVGIIDDSVKDNSKKILANVKDSYTTETGGIHPTFAKEHHIKCADSVVKEALQVAGIKLEQVDLICFSQSPGLAPCLVVGMEKAKELALKIKKPIVGVNHCIAHLEIGKLLTKAKNPVLLYVSGANTQVIAYDGGKYRIFGETLDNGVGNFIDGFGRYLGLGFPQGPKIAEFAQKAVDNGPNFIEIPYVVKGMDISVGGILTNLKQKVDSGKFKNEDLAYSMQETVFAMLTEVAERAMAHCEKNELLLGGGVCCNTRLQEMAKQMCKDRNAECFIIENQYNVDNGAMIAWLGVLAHKAGLSIDPNNKKKLDAIDIKPRERTDDVVVKW